MRLLSVSGTLLFVATSLLPATARAASHDDLLDPAALVQLEARALHAEAREQCFLYTELVEGYTQAAGRQMAAGDMDQASASLRHVERYAQLIHMGLARDAKRLKNAEMRMHNATFHLGSYLHLLSSDDQATVRQTLNQLDKVNDELLAQVFAH